MYYTVCSQGRAGCIRDQPDVPCLAEATVAVVINEQAVLFCDHHGQMLIGPDWCCTGVLTVGPETVTQISMGSTGIVLRSEGMGVVHSPESMN